MDWASSTVSANDFLWRMSRFSAEILNLFLYSASRSVLDSSESTKVLDTFLNSSKDAPIGQVPYLEIDNLKLPQSLAIARYLAREYNLVGKNNLEAAKADAVVDTCIDLMTSLYNQVYLVSDAKDKVSLNKHS